MAYGVEMLNQSTTMKKLTAVLLLMAFSAATVMQAGEGATGNKAKGSCCESSKTSAQAKSSCSDTSSCGASKKAAVTAVKPDAKGAALLVRIQSEPRAKS